MDLEWNTLGCKKPSLIFKFILTNDSNNCKIVLIVTDFSIVWHQQITNQEMQNNLLTNFPLHLSDFKQFQSVINRINSSMLYNNLKTNQQETNITTEFKNNKQNLIIKVNTIINEISLPLSYTFNLQISNPEYSFQIISSLSSKFMTTICSLSASNHTMHKLLNIANCKIMALNKYIKSQQKSQTDKIHPQLFNIIHDWESDKEKYLLSEEFNQHSSSDNLSDFYQHVLTATKNKTKIFNQVNSKELTSNENINSNQEDNSPSPSPSKRKRIGELKGKAKINCKDPIQESNTDISNPTTPKKQKIYLEPEEIELSPSKRLQFKFREIR